MNTCIFVVGTRDAGKTSMIRSLTGCGFKARLWNVRNKQQKKLRAFVITSAITEISGRKNPPDKFPKSLEKRFKVKRDQYDLLICPFELDTWGRYSFDKYVQAAIKRRFKVKVAIIKKAWDGYTHNISKINKVCKQYKLKKLVLDASKDYNKESSKIKKFYPG